MSKIVCDICGTTYPETATQCPICGSARPADIQPLETGSNGGSYTYVKGGRFSKANVRKRSSGKNPPAAAPKQPKPAKKTEAPAPQRKEKQTSSDSSNRGLIITAIVLLIAVIAVVGYIAVRYFFVPESNGAANIKDTIPCVSVDVEKDEIKLELEEGKNTATLKVTTMPTNTTDKVTFTPSDESVVTVDENGVVTAKKSGKVQIVISCGGKSAVVNVTVEDNEKIELNLTRKSLTLEALDETYILYIKEVSGIEPSDITWTTDNDKVATIVDGVVTAVGEGVTDVHGEYKGVKVSCTITVTINDENNNNGNGVGEDDGDIGNGNGVGEDGGNGTDNTTPVGGIKIYTLWDTELTDFTVSVGEVVNLVIKDEQGNVVSATVTVADASVCSVSGCDVTGVGAGVTKITVTSNGMTATCIVRCG